MPGARRAVVGAPTEADALRARARRLGVADHLLVVGQVAAGEVAEAHAAADVFAMTHPHCARAVVEVRYAGRRGRPERRAGDRLFRHRRA